MSEGPAISPETARQIDQEVNRLSEEGHERARSLLRAHRKAFDALVAALLERETLDDKQIAEVVESTEPLPPQELREPGKPIPVPSMFQATEDPTGIARPEMT